MMNLAEYRRTSSRLADYLPWAALVGSGVVLNKDGSFQRSAKFRGPDLDSAVAAELVAVAGRINNAVRRLGSGWSIFVEAQRSEAATRPTGALPDAGQRLSTGQCANVQRQQLTGGSPWTAGCWRGSGPLCSSPLQSPPR